MPEEGWLSIITGPAMSIFCSILAAIFTGIIFRMYGKLKRVGDKYIKKIDQALDQVDEFTSIEDFFRMFKDVVDSYDDYSRVALIRCLPFELGLDYLKYLYDDVNHSETAKSALLKYKAVVRNIIEEDYGSHDKTIYGVTGIPKLDGCTARVLQDPYLKLPGTSELGHHKNLNEFGVILFGKTESVRTDRIEEWDAGFLIIFSDDFRTFKGFKYKRHQHIQTIYSIFKQKKEDLKMDEEYLILDESNRNHKTIIQDLLDTVYKTT